MKLTRILKQASLTKADKMTSFNTRITLIFWLSDQVVGSGPILINDNKNRRNYRGGYGYPSGRTWTSETESISRSWRTSYY